jgi:hypothetical protein
MLGLADTRGDSLDSGEEQTLNTDPIRRSSRFIPVHRAAFAVAAGAE